jgi:hypothetical protein
MATTIFKSNEQLSKSAICSYLDRIHREITIEKGIIDRLSLQTFLEKTISDNDQYLEEVKDIECSDFLAYKVYIYTAKCLHEFLFSEYIDGIEPEMIAKMIIKHYWKIVNGIFDNGKIDSNDVKLIIE